VRFAPPLVIEEEDLRGAVKVIGECLEDLDNVRYRLLWLLLSNVLFPCSWTTFQVISGARRDTRTL